MVTKKETVAPSTQPCSLRMDPAQPSSAAAVERASVLAAKIYMWRSGAAHLCSPCASDSLACIARQADTRQALRSPSTVAAQVEKCAANCVQLRVHKQRPAGAGAARLQRLRRAGALQQQTVSR
jgi:hypothetical protein